MVFPLASGRAKFRAARKTGAAALEVFSCRIIAAENEAKNSESKSHYLLIQALRIQWFPGNIGRVQASKAFEIFQVTRNKGASVKHYHSSGPKKVLLKMSEAETLTRPTICFA